MRRTDLSCTWLLGFLFLKSDCGSQLKTGATTNTHGQTDKTPKCPSRSEGPALPAAGPGSLTQLAPPPALRPGLPASKRTEKKPWAANRNPGSLESRHGIDGGAPSPFTRLAASFMPARGPGRGHDPTCQRSRCEGSCPSSHTRGKRSGTLSCRRAWEREGQRLSQRGAAAGAPAAPEILRKNPPHLSLSSSRAYVSTGDSPHSRMDVL